MNSKESKKSLACKLSVLFIAILLLLLPSTIRSILNKNSNSKEKAVYSESDINVLQEQLSNANKNIDDKERKIRELTDELSSLALQLEDLKMQNEDLQKTIVAQSDILQNGKDLFKAVQSHVNIAFHTSETDYIVIGKQFMEIYAAHLLMASAYYPSNEYAITDFMLVGEPTLPEAESAQPVSVEDGVVFTIQCTYAIQPAAPLGETSPWRAGNTSVYAEREGWYKMSSVIKLKLANSGDVLFISVGTGI